MTVHWGMIGCGAVTEVKSGPALQKAEGSRLVAVMGRDGARAADYAQRHGVPRSYDDARRLIEDPGVDAIYVATPPGSHLDYALMACQAGKPAYVEKPMARNHAECRTMVEAFQAAGLPLFVAYYRRALPRFLRIRELVQSGRLGRVTAIACRLSRPGWAPLAPADLPWRVRAGQSGGGLFLDLGSHTLDLLDFIFGPLREVRGRAVNQGGRYPVEDGVVLQFCTEAGALGTALWNFTDSRQADHLLISGTEAELWTPTFEPLPVELRSPAGVERLDLPYPEHIQQPLIQTIVDQLSGRGACPSTGVSAARTSAVMDAALLSYYGTRDPGFWDGPERWPGWAGRTPWGDAHHLGLTN